MKKTPSFPVLCKNIVGSIAILAMLMFVVSCQKSTPSTGGTGGASDKYYIKFKVNGEQKNYTSQAMAEFAKKTADGVYSGGLVGYSNIAQGTKDEIAIILLSTTPIAVTTYADPLKAVKQDGSILPQVVINYNDPAGRGYLTMGAAFDANGTSPIPNLVADARVTISEIGSTFVKGTFSGTSYESIDPTYMSKAVLTEGEFYLQLAK